MKQQTLTNLIVINWTRKLRDKASIPKYRIKSKADNELWNSNNLRENLKWVGKKWNLVRYIYSGRFGTKA